MAICAIGALGKRTRFQHQSVSQLVLEVRRGVEAATCGEVQPATSDSMPHVSHPPQIELSGQIRSQYIVR